jgi:hypothetical protein
MYYEKTANWKRKPTDQPTNQPTNQPTDRLHGAESLKSFTQS